MKEKESRTWTRERWVMGRWGSWILAGLAFHPSSFRLLLQRAPCRCSEGNVASSFLFLHLSVCSEAGTWLQLFFSVLTPSLHSGWPGLQTLEMGIPRPLQPSTPGLFTCCDCPLLRAERVLTLRSWGLLPCHFGFPGICVCPAPVDHMYSPHSDSLTLCYTLC